ncbi:hypothetical protein D9613_004231 [Agrocybe pediades]|uniref:Uncharacterized protein n=1 Tax=Agrocybe pediades TaxID=84607 RepID=A0A8H4QK07_9AGAR|nr:hypothetical protein D9613_004231 [Agrocybe pediades]
MQCVGSTRPALRSSALSVCRYSTTPKGSKIVSEWDGIVIPSREEIQEKVKEVEASKKKYEADISYLKNAPERSLASRLARARPPKAEPKPAEPQPQATAEPLSAVDRERIEEITRRRREARIARETAQANAALRIMPQADMSKVIQAASNFKIGSVPPTTRPQGAFYRDAGARKEPRPQSERRPKALDQVRVSSQPVQPIRAAEVLPTAAEDALPNMEPSDNAPETESVLLESDGENIELSTAEPSPMFQNTRVMEMIASTIKKSREELQREGIPETHPLSAEGLAADSAAKRREERLRRQAQELRMKRGEEGVPSKDNARDSVAKRKAARLQRLEAGRDEAPERRRSKNTRQPSLESVSTGGQDLEDPFDIDEDTEAYVGPAFTGPEPISSTLLEIFQPSVMASLNPIALDSKKIAARGGEEYTQYVQQFDRLYATPPNQLGPFNVAKRVLAHRPDVSRPQRKHALDIIAASTQRTTKPATAKA